MGNMNFLKGMGAGLVVGACVGMAMAPDKKKSKSTVSKAVKAVETIISDVADVMGM
jgi:gas vesicle protein